MLGVGLVFCIVLLDALKRMSWSGGKCVLICLSAEPSLLMSRLEAVLVVVLGVQVDLRSDF